MCFLSMSCVPKILFSENLHMGRCKKRKKENTHFLMNVLMSQMEHRDTRRDGREGRGPFLSFNDCRMFLRNYCVVDFLSLGRNESER